MVGQPMDPAPFVHISNAAAELNYDIEICTQLGSMGQIFVEASAFYVKPALKLIPTPAVMPNKHLRPAPTQNDESKCAKKQKEAEKEGRLKRAIRGGFCQPANLSVTCCSQHFIVGCSCRYQLKNDLCNFQYIE
eukprot:14698761-Ditylum_brightwellii.AAC.1